MWAWVKFNMCYSRYHIMCSCDAGCYTCIRLEDPGCDMTNIKIKIKTNYFPTSGWLAMCFGEEVLGKRQKKKIVVVVVEAKEMLVLVRDKELMLKGC